ncbi:hypothetical protein GCM10010112_43040 [Actinoplanes lobatus]|uniref:Uncharacterized protein n=1 Tax=Actinoplanes lobatus TaxID=113568 RepID=A0ABQ4AFK8_9ACTN|nr:hypothetical protein GCM10010112_43040 [Actinoplanes lobatus]GIE39782.1 hypothetical protein Alo02nite_26800 [Actinoplanes lobatus]
MHHEDDSPEHLAITGTVEVPELVLNPIRKRLIKGHTSTYRLPARALASPPRALLAARRYRSDSAHIKGSPWRFG